MKDFIDNKKADDNKTTRKTPLDEVISSAKQRVSEDPQPNTKITDDVHEIIREH